MCCGLQRFLRDNGRPGFNVFEEPKFKHFQDCLDAEMNRLTNIGVGSTVRQAEPLGEEEEQKLWNLGLLGKDSPSVLLNTMVFLIGKNFSLRSGREHRYGNLKFSQLTLVPGTDREPEKLVYVSFGKKNNLGALKHRNVTQKRIEHYANDEEPAMYLVLLYKKYLEKCPKTAVQGNNVFYLTPRQKYKSTDEGMITINIDHLQFGCKRIKMSVSFNSRKPETVIRSFSFVSYFYFHC